MKTNYTELYTDYLMVNTTGYATATGLSAMMEGEVSHDEITGSPHKTMQVEI